jgi:hypothetical protein
MPKTFLRRASKWILASAVLLLAIQPLRATNPAKHRKIVVIAGSKSHGPGTHEYLKSARLLKVLLDRAVSKTSKPK